MKLNKSILLGAACLLSLSSCSDWLDVNVSPNSPTDDILTYDKRLAHIEFYTNHAYWFAGQPCSGIVGDMTYTNRTGTYGQFPQWQMNSGRETTVYQWFFVGAGSNIYPLINSALENQAYHYAGAGHLILAYGMGLLHDLQGELPCYDALGSNVTPTYPTGREMYRFVIENIDKAIEYLNMAQGPDAIALSANDYWGKGDVEKWKKFAYLLKARYLNRLIKKGQGTFSLENDNFVYDPNLILDCLDKSFKSNSDNMQYAYQDLAWTTNDVLGWSEPVNYNPLYSVMGMNGGYFFTRTVFDRLTNFDNKGIEDPRADHILPWARSSKTATTPDTYTGQKIKWSDDGKWRRTVGVDMQTTIRTEAAPYATSWDAKTGHFYCNNEKRKADTLFVHQRCSGTGYERCTDLMYYTDGQLGKGNEASAVSGTFYTRPDAPALLGTYYEACFIRAEVLFNLGRVNEAFTAYKEGIRANMEMMNAKLKEWSNISALANCPSFTPMSDAAINNYLETAIGNAGNLTLGKIMTQKMIAMQFNPEQWADMRRYDYNPTIFMHWNVPAEYYINSGSMNNIPDLAKNKGPRRWRVSSHEYNYNTTNLNAVGEYLVRDGAKWTAGDPDEQEWWNELDMYVIPVWWDTNHLD